jgi:hypothetical protein
MTQQPLAWSRPNDHSAEPRSQQPFEEQHYSIRYWALRWSFSKKTVREWFRDEHGPGILRQSNVGRRKKRDYTTMMISPTAAARVYTKRTGEGLGQRRTREVM